MKCAWKELLAILPQPIRSEMEKYGKEHAQELRLRLDKPPELICTCGVRWLDGTVSEEDLRFVVNAASRYSPWAASSSVKGYITARGGHRIGLCGEMYSDGGQVRGVRNLTSLNIRVARDYTGLAPKDLEGNVLILGPPGSGKTTLLRDLCRQVAQKRTVTVVDERGELFPTGFLTGKRMDIMTGCSKADGIAMALRTMGPEYIAVDEISEEQDCLALRSAGWCGVKLLATAHAACREDLTRRRIYRPLVESGIFEELLILRPDKSWNRERIGYAV